MNENEFKELLKVVSDKILLRTYKPFVRNIEDYPVYYLRTSDLKVFDINDNEISISDLMICYFYIDSKDLCFIGSGNIISKYGMFTRASNGYPENLDSYFNTCEDVYLLSEGLYDNMNDSFFTCAWSHKPNIIYLNLWNN